MNDTTLTRIRQKELELQAGLLAARQQAEALILAANQRTDAVMRAIDLDTANRVQGLRADVARESQREVAEVRAEHARQAEALTAAAGLVPALTKRIVDAVVAAPSPDAEGTPLARPI